ncbi:MAG: glycosyltransferase [Bacteroidetes bacterium]|nr:glycosyltransferase [Bacteroidota bacterium]
MEIMEFDQVKSGNNKSRLIGVWGLYEELCRNNKMFFCADAPIGDNLLKPTNELYKYFKSNNLELKSIDTIANLEDSELFIFFDFPNNGDPLAKKVFATDKPKFLIINESKIITPINWHPLYLQHFTKVFTYNDDVVDNKKYFKLNYAFDLPENFSIDNNKREKFCSMIVSNKGNSNEYSLYSERINCIKWFEENAPEKFDLFGQGWNSIDYPSYKGSVKSKFETYQNYKFAICYENVKDVNGYVTEKIVDSLLAGCIPVYLGAANIAEHIPESCFIDKRKYGTYKELLEHLYSLTDSDILEYQNNIKKFFISKESYPFSIDSFVKTLYKHCSATLTENIKTSKKKDFHETEKMPLVSICIPTFNRAKMLSTAISSALLQSYKNIEVIVSDNNSEDDTESVCANFVRNNNKVRYIKQKENIGGLLNMKECVQSYANGEYVLVLSDDDFFIEENYIERAVNLILDNPATDFAFVFSNFVVIDSTNYNVEAASEYNLPVIMKGTDVFEYFYDPFNVPLLTSLFNRRKAIKVNAFNHGDVPAEDTILWLKLCFEGDVGFINTHPAAYSVNTPQGSANLDRKFAFTHFAKNIFLFVMPARYAFEKGINLSYLRKWKIKMIDLFKSPALPYQEIREYYEKSAVLVKLKELYESSIAENYSFHKELEIEEKIIQSFRDEVNEHVSKF